MRRITIVFVCAMIAPLAFAQPVAYTSVVDHTGITQRATTQMTTSAVKIGTVAAFDPGLIPVEPPSPIVVQSSPDTKPVSYMLGRQVRFMDTDDRAIDPRLVQAGTRVELGFDRTGKGQSRYWSWDRDWTGLLSLRVLRGTVILRVSRASSLLSSPPSSLLPHLLSWPNNVGISELAWK